jgi:hypothetical protein
MWAVAPKEEEEEEEDRGSENGTEESRTIREILLRCSNTGG